MKLKQKISISVVFTVIISMGVLFIAAMDYTEGIHIFNSGSIKIDIDEDLYVYDIVSDEFTDMVHVNIEGEGNANRLCDAHKMNEYGFNNTEFTEENGFAGNIYIDGYNLMDNIITLENTDEKVYRNKYISRTRYGIDGNIEIINYTDYAFNLVLKYNDKRKLYETCIQEYFPRFNMILFYDAENTDKYLIQIEEYKYTPDNTISSQIKYITNVNDKREVLKMIIASDIFYYNSFISQAPIEIIDKYDLYDYWREVSINFCEAEIDYKEEYKNEVSDDDFEYNYCIAEIEYLKKQKEDLKTADKKDLLTNIEENAKELNNRLEEIFIKYAQNENTNDENTLKNTSVENDRIEYFYVDEDKIVKIEGIE